MKIGLLINTYHYPNAQRAIAPVLRDIAQTADQGGFSSLWVLDHFFQMPAGALTEPMLDSYSALNYMAGLTRQINLGVMVTGVIYRHPAVLVKIVTTLDVLSEGRAWLGIGAAWYEREAKGLGIPFPVLAARFEQLEETVQIARQMWAGDTSPYLGRHFQLEEPINSPQPVRQPHPPILIGGAGEKKTLRLVAQYADACNFGGEYDLETIRRKLAVLKDHCAALNRDYANIEKTAVRDLPAGFSAAQTVDFFGALAELGIQHVIMNIPDFETIEPIRRIAETVIPQVIG